MKRITLPLFIFFIVVSLLGIDTTYVHAGTLGGEPPDFVFVTNQPTFVVPGAGVHTVTGSIGPTPTDGQDPFFVQIPAGLEVTSVSFSGPTGANFPHNLVGCGLTGVGNLNQTFAPPQTNCILEYYINTNLATSAIAWTVTVNVQAVPGGDTIPPVLNLPANITTNTDPGLPTAVVTYTFAPTDNVGVTSSSCTPASGSTFALGTTTVNCTASDAAGNTTNGSFTVTVVDNEPPALNLPANIVTNTDPGLATAVVTYTFAPTDNVSVATGSCTPTSGSAFAIGTTSVNCTASDLAGNTSNGSFTVTVNDAEPPALNLPANIVTNTDPGLPTAVVTYAFSATDNVGVTSSGCSPVSGSAFAIGITTVNCTASDAAGNTTTGSFTVTVNTNALASNASCANGSVSLNISAGDNPFTINYLLDGVPQTQISAGVIGNYTLPGDNLGPNAFTNIIVTEIGGDAENVNLGNLNCNVPLVASAVCNGNNLDINITSGDANFSITATTPGGPLNMSIGSLGTTPIAGPNWWQGLTIAETTGDTETTGSLGDFNCGSAGVAVTPTTASNTSESGTTSTFTVVLTSVPESNVAIAWASQDTSEVEVSSDGINFATSQTQTFTPVNWNIPQTITLRGIDDPVVDGDISVIILSTLTSADIAYGAIDPADVSVINIDDDVPLGNATLIVDPKILLVAEDAPGVNTVNISLGAIPSAGEIVTVTLTFDNTQLAISPTILNFNAANYNSVQVVNVDAIADGIFEPHTNYIVTATASSNLGVTIFTGLTQNITVTVFDFASDIIGHVPNLGELTVFASHPVTLLQGPNGGPVRDRVTMAEYIMPQDYDGNGFDTYTIAEYEVDDNGTLWLGVWIGNMNWGWFAFNADTMQMSGGIWEQLYFEGYTP